MQVAEGEKFMDDIECGCGPSEALNVFSHKGHSLGVVEELIDFVAKDGKIVAAYGDTFFEQVV